VRKSAVLVPIALAFGVIILGPRAGAQAAPTPITQCQSIDNPGSYVLANNLTAATGLNCLTINAEFVTINLAGFRINCNTGALNGISASFLPPNATSPKGIAVRNGSITNCLHGVDFSAANAAIVEELQVVGSQLQGIVASGIIRNNILVNNGFSGITISPGGLFTGDGGIAINNYTAGNGGAGTPLGISAEGQATIIHNRVTDGIGSGSGATMIGNTVNNRITVGCPSNLVDNTADHIIPVGNDCHLEDNVETGS
jgi:hypothetical protein